MPPDVLHRLTVVHRIIAWFDTLLLLAVAILLLRDHWRDKRWFFPLSITATLGTIASFASGMALELHYRVHLRQRLFIHSKTLGWLFERKMHLAFGMLTMSLIGLLTLFLTRQDERFFRVLRYAYVFAALFALTISVISSVVGVLFKAS